MRSESPASIFRSPRVSSPPGEPIPRGGGAPLGNTNGADRFRAPRISGLARHPFVPSHALSPFSSLTFLPSFALSSLSFPGDGGGTIRRIRETPLIFQRHGRRFLPFVSALSLIEFRL